jgi:hypothetical protein
MKPKGSRRGNGAVNVMDSKGTLRWRWIYLEDGKQFKNFSSSSLSLSFLPAIPSLGTSAFLTAQEWGAL